MLFFQTFSNNAPSAYQKLLTPCLYKFCVCVCVWGGGGSPHEQQNNRINNKLFKFLSQVSESNYLSYVS